MRGIYLRKANELDTKFVFQLKSSKEVRKTSINKKKINYRQHILWFKKKIKEKKSLFFIVCNKKSGEKLGYVRLDHENFYYRITIAIIKKKTNLNFGYQALKAIEKKVHSNSLLFAQVVQSNVKSIKLFKKCNYKLVGSNKDIKFFFKLSNKK